MLRRRAFSVGFGIVILAAACAARKPGSEIKPGFNLFSKDQDIQLGKEAAAQVRRQYEVVNNSELQNYIARIGQRLASQPEAGNFPYSFTLLNDKSVNAFALPGGPTFVFTGLILAADNEAQLAGVLAHEISHVALRHATNQASKANLLQIPAALAGAAIGNSTLGQLAQLGLGLGLNGWMLKFSRTDESQADELGTRIMSEAGYNPIEMARFFEKLEAEGGSRAPQFLSDHPNPGNRVKDVEREIQALPQHAYNADTGQFPRMKQLVAQLPPPHSSPRRSSAAPMPNGPAPQSSGGFRQLQGRTFALSYPADWRAYGDSNSDALTIAPQGGITQNAVGYGAIISYYLPESNRLDLRQATDDLIHHLHANNPNMQLTSRNYRSVRVDGNQGLTANFTSDSPFGGNETDVLLTVARPEGLFYMILVAPEREFGRLQGTFDQMVRSIRFRSS